MNSGGASAGGSLGAARELERQEPSNEAGREQAAELWVALAQQLTQTPAPTLPAASTEPPSSWHSSAGDMTPGGVMTSASGGAPAPQQSSERMVLRVDGGALGELEVTLDRENGALRVVIGMENQGLVGSVLPDARVLQSALEAAGLNVQSLNVVTASEVGTVLAQRRLSPSGPKPVASESAEPDPEKAQKKAHKRLTLIG